MRDDIPYSQQFDAFELESKGLRDFFKIEFNDVSHSVMFITPHDPVDFIDEHWEQWPCKLTDNSQNSTGEQSRPKFTAVNPQGVFSVWVEKGFMDGAILTRYRVLLSDLKAGVRNYTKSIWVVSKVLNLNKQMVIVELRSTLDGANFILPARSFYPPDFPHVSLR